MKHFVSAAVLAAGTLIAGLAGAPSPALAKNQIVLGLTFDKTGLYASTGRPTEIAVDIAVKEINDAGGINGMPIKLVKFDTGGDPKQAVAAVRKFAEDDKALAIIGPFSSSEARVAFPAEGRLQGSVSGGIGELVITLPPDMPTRLTVSTGIGGFSAPSSFVRRDNVYETPGFSTAGDYLDLTLSLGIGQITVK